MGAVGALRAHAGRRGARARTPRAALLHAEGRPRARAESLRKWAVMEFGADNRVAADAALRTRAPRAGRRRGAPRRRRRRGWRMRRRRFASKPSRKPSRRRVCGARKPSCCPRGRRRRAAAATRLWRASTWRAPWPATPGTSRRRTRSRGWRSFAATTTPPRLCIARFCACVRGKRTRASRSRVCWRRRAGTSARARRVRRRRARQPGEPQGAPELGSHGGQAGRGKRRQRRF